MDNMKAVNLNSNIVSLLKEIANETNSTLVSVADYYLRTALETLNRPTAEDLVRRKPRGRKSKKNAEENTELYSQSTTTNNQHTSL